MPVVSEQWDIVSLIEREAGIRLHGKVSRVKGLLEYHSNCPWCGGTDRFKMTPETGEYTCKIRSSGCGKSGDGLDFLQDYRGMTFAEAVEHMEVQGKFSDAKGSKREFVEIAELPPCKGWQETCINLVLRAEVCLWGPTGKPMLDYLHGRGLGDDIIKKKRLGYIPLQSDGSFRRATIDKFGLDPAKYPDQKYVYVQDGILIPWFEGETLWKMTIERPGQDPAKPMVLGSQNGLYNVDMIDIDKPVMMVESVLCALSVEQEAGDLVACVATGGTKGSRLNRWLSDLSFAEFLLQSFDEEKAGDEGAEYWLKIKKSMRWSPLIAKDPNDILQGKFNSEYKCTLREWVEAGVNVGRVAIFPPKEEAPIVIEVPIAPAPLIEVPPCKVEEEIDVSRIKFYEHPEEMKQAILSEYQLMSLVPSSHPVKPLNLCKDHGERQWFWSSTAGEWACLECLLGQLSYTKKQAKPLVNRTW